MVAGSEVVLADPAFGAFELPPRRRIIWVDGEDPVRLIARFVEVTQVKMPEAQFEVFLDLLHIGHVLLAIGRIEPLGIVKPVEQPSDAGVAGVVTPGAFEERPGCVVLAPFRALLRQLHRRIDILRDHPLALPTVDFSIRQQVERGAVMSQAGLVVSLGHRLVPRLLFLARLDDPLLAPDDFPLGDALDARAVSFARYEHRRRRPGGESREEGSRKGSLVQGDVY